MTTEKLYLCLDIGGTKIDASLIDSSGKFLKKEHQKTKKTKKEVLNQVVFLISKLFNQKVKTIGISLAGRIDKNGKIIFSPNLPLKNFPLRTYLERKFKRPVLIENDAVCFTLAEFYFSKKNYHHFIGITWGTGIGGGIIINKKIYSGQQKMAGEFGHLIISDKNIFKCSCGQWNHWESLASGRALTNWYKKFNGKNDTAEKIIKRYFQGEQKAKKAVEKIIKYMAKGLVNITYSFNPEVIVIGGGLTNQPFLLKETIKQTKKLIPSCFKINIKPSKLKEKANLLGIYLIIRRKK